MFGSRAKKPETEKKKRNHDLSQFGLFQVPSDLDGNLVDDDDDDDLEAELAAITSGQRGQPKRPPPPKQIIPAADLDRMVAESLRDDDGDDDDVDENDPELLNELHGITGGGDEDAGETVIESTAAGSEPAGNQVDLLKGRLELYRVAEANAKAAGDAGKARRIGRGLKTLQDQLKQAQAGRTIDPDDIPPEVSTKAASVPVMPPVATPPVSVPTRSAPAPPQQQTDEQIPSPDAILVDISTDDPPQPASAEPPVASPLDSSVADNATPTPLAIERDEAALTALNARKREFQLAALAAKKSGDRDGALRLIRILKQFDAIIAEAMAGRPVDLSNMPDAPQPSVMATDSPAAPTDRPAREDDQHQTSSAGVQPPIAGEPVVEADTPSTPATVAEALQQRLDKYRSVEAAAKAEGNASKARRYARIVKQYSDAVTAHRLGRPVPFDELPTPPGFGPIPGVQPAPAEVPTVAAQPDQPSVPPARPPPPAAAQPAPPPSSRLAGNHSSTALMHATIQTLTDRQREFRRAAVDAKQAGNMTQAKEYLRQFKQLDQLLEVARGGMPIDMSTVPLGPAQRAGLEDSFSIVSADDCSTADTLGDVGERLQQQLQRQLAMCRQTRDHHRAMGDVVGQNRFENLALSVQKDIDMVRLAKAHNRPVPKFHYSSKRFDIVRCNTDLADTELQIEVLRGIGYSVPNPKDVDTYVKIEVPLPSAELPFRARTQLVRDTDSPTYDEKFIVEIAPKQRACQRVFKRHAVKLEVFSKGGFLRSDVLIGTVLVKLQALETVCEVHNSFDLMDGRKTTGGKLEVKLRTRNPILTTQIEHVDEKWLVIDS